MVKRHTKMSVLSQALRIHEGFMKHIDNITDIKRQSVGGQKLRLEELLCDVTKSRDDTKQMIRDIDESVELNSEKKARLEEKIRMLEENESLYHGKIAELEREIFEQDERIRKLEEDVQGLSTQLTLAQSRLDDQEQTKTKLKELESALHTGQLAFDFEKDLATYIYPHDKKFGSRKIFTNMKKWLEDKNDTIQGGEANEKWDSLKDEFSWSSEHEEVFFKLLDLRKKCAHPEVDRDAIQSQIPEDFNDDEKKMH